MAEYKYSQLQSVAVGMVEETVTLNMKAMVQGEQRSFSFETEQKEDIASLIASYSPAHGNWQRVGEAKTKMVRFQNQFMHSLFHRCRVEFAL